MMAVNTPDELQPYENSSSSRCDALRRKINWILQRGTVKYNSKKRKHIEGEKTWTAGNKQWCFGSGTLISRTGVNRHIHVQ
jgi:hypothetical protein